MWGSCFSLGSSRGYRLRLRLALRRLLFITYSLTRSLARTHTRTHARTHALTHSLPHSSLTHSLTPLTHSLTVQIASWLPLAWQAQYTGLPGGAAARWPPLARGCLLPGRRSTQSLRTSLVRGRRSTQSFLAELRRGGRRWPAAAFCRAGTVHRASALPFCVAGAVYWYMRACHLQCKLHGTHVGKDAGARNSVFSCKVAGATAAGEGKLWQFATLLGPGKRAPPSPPKKSFFLSLPKET